jgi:hypothetical protein
MKLRRKKLIVELVFFFLSNEWGMRVCEEGGVMMMVVRRKRGSWHIMKRQGG